MYEWLRDIRTGMPPVATFFFPENQALPDVMFALCWTEDSETGDSGINGSASGGPQTAGPKIHRLVVVVQVSTTLMVAIVWLT